MKFQSSSASASATHDGSDDGDWGEGTKPLQTTVKERNLQRKINRGKEMIVAKKKKKKEKKKKKIKAASKPVQRRRCGIRTKNTNMKH